MKKRVLSLVLTLCMLLGLLSAVAPASAASSALGEKTVDMERVNKVDIKGKEDTEFIFDSDPRWGERYYYIGDDKGSDELGIHSAMLNTDFYLGADMGLLNFAGMWLNYPVNGVGGDIANIERSMNDGEPKQFITASQNGKLQIDVKETSGGRNDSNIAYVPFALAVEVPAQTSQTVRYTFDISASRNSKGAAGYYAEILRCPYSPTTITKPGGTSYTDYEATYLSTFMKQSVHLQMGDTAKASDLSITPNGLKPGQRAYWETKTGGFTQITTEVQYVNNTDQPKRMARYFALYMGVGASSGITSPYRHNLQCTINISRSNVDSELLIPQVAQVGETKYETIEEAVAAYNQQDGQTLTLLENVFSRTGQVSLTASGTVDLNGKEWKEKGFLIGSPNGNKTVTIRNGMLQCSAEETSSGSFIYVNGGCTLNLGVGEDKASVRSGGQCRTAVAVGPNGHLGITNTIFGREVDIQLLEGAQIDILGPLGNTKSGSDTFRLAVSGTATLANPITIAHGDRKWETTTTNTASGEDKKYQTPGEMFTLTNMPGYTAAFSEDTTDTSTTVVVRPIQLTLDANGGTCGVTQIGTNQALPTPIKPGYTFSHWSEYPSGPNAVDLSKIKEDTTLYAQWKAAEFNVTFDANGGAFEGTAPAAITAKYGELYKLPDDNPTRTGYNFAGWYTQAEDGTRVSMYTPCEQTGDHTLYAHWNPKTVKVTLNAHGGTVNSGGITVAYDGTYGTLPIPTRAGYAFDGWYTQSEDGEQVTAETKVAKENDHTLHAHWKASGVTVALHNVGENGAGTGTATVTYGDTYGDAITSFTRPGHRLLGWAPTEAEAAAGSVSVFESSRVTNSNDHDLWAVWFRFSYPVTFRDGGTTLSTASVLYGEKVAQPDNPTKGDFTFLGWTKTKDGTDYWDFDTDTVTGSTTLYAAWEKPQCAVTLDANGGSFDGDEAAATKSVTVPYGTIIGATDHAPTRKGYTFIGWSGSKNGPAAGQSITAARTLYAIWEAKKVTISFNGTDITWERTYGQNYIPLNGSLPEAPAGEGEFRGWYTEQNGGGTRIYPDTLVTIDQDHTLYAYWTADHTHDGQTFTAWNGSGTPAAGGYYYLEDSASKITVPEGEVHLCLNGHTLGDAASTNSPISLGANQTLHLYDCSAGQTGKVTAQAGTGSTSSVVYLKSGTAAFYLHSGTICDSGLGVYVKYGSFTMDGGAIRGNTNTNNYTDGGGVYIQEGAFTMNGGTISGNTARTSGGGVYMYESKEATFTMNGGTITGNTAPNYGGGVYVGGENSTVGGTFTMNGGTISGNTATKSGGGVYISEKATSAEITGGVISGNTASGNGGGVYVNSNTYMGSYGPLTMTGGTIRDNKAVNGGGVYAVYNCTVGGTITGNTATGNGGGVYASSSMNLDNAEITGNKVTGTDAAGGGMYSKGSATMKGLVTITGNTKEVDEADPAASNFYFYSTDYKSPYSPITAKELANGSKIGVGFSGEGYQATYNKRALTEDLDNWDYTETFETAKKYLPYFSVDEPGKYYLTTGNMNLDGASGTCVILKPVTAEDPGPGPVTPDDPTPAAHTHRPCGADSCSHDGHSSATYTAYKNDLTGNVYLEADVETLTVSGDVNLCLNGHSVQTLNVTGGTLTLCDCQGGGTVTSVSVTGGTLNVYGGDLPDFEVNNGTVNLNGGSTGSLTVGANATVTLDGGSVNGDVTNGGTLTLKSGAVTGDVKHNGGTLTLDGKPVLTGQIELAESQTITIGTNAQQPDAPYTVKTATNPTATAPVTIATGWSEDKAPVTGWFTPAAGGTEVKAKDGNVEFALPPRTVTVVKPDGSTETLKTKDDGTIDTTQLPTNEGPAPTGKVPDGWTTDPGGGADGKITDTTVIDEDTMIYPCWKDCTEHNWQVTETVESTCETEGHKVSTCSLCKETKTEPITELAKHSFGEKWVSDQTAHWHVCTICGLKSDLATHTPGTEVVSSQASTCTTAGWQLFRCTVCSTGVPVDLPKLPHEFTGAWETDNEHGAHQRKCANCDATTDWTSHDYAIPGAVTKEPGIGVAGAQAYLCVCGASKSVELPALPEPEKVVRTYSVTFDLGQHVEGEAPAMAPQEEKAEFNLPALTATRTGYTFQGWDYTTTVDKTETVGGQTVTIPEEVTTTYAAGGSFTMPAQSVRFTAHWERDASTTLNPGDTLVLDDGTKIEVKDDGTVTVDKDGDGQPDTTVTLPSGTNEVVVKPETKTDDGGGETTKDTIVLPGGSVVDPNPGGDGPKVTVGDGGGSLDTDGNSKLPEGSTVETENDDGTKTTVTIGSGGDGNVEPDGTVTFPEGGNATVQTGDEEPVPVEIPKPEPGKEPEDITVQPCTVTFDMQDHGTQIAPITNVTPGSKITAPADPTAEGWVFGGWFWNSDFEESTKWDFETDTVDSNLVLYAKWTQKAEKPNISGQPTAPTEDLIAGQIPTGDEAPKLTVTVETPKDDGELSYQWYEKDENGDWKPIENATDPTYTIPKDIQPGDHEYRCEVTNTGDDKEPVTVTTDEVTVTVSTPVTPTVTVPDNDKTLEIKQGETKKIEVTVEPEGTEVTWTSSDPSVVTVDEDGTVTAVGPGTATITITPAGGDPVEITVTVTDPAEPDNTVDLGGGITVTLPEGSKPEDITDNDDGTKKVPEGSIVHIGDDNPAITLPDGGDVKPGTGEIKVPEGEDSTITIEDKGGNKTNITIPGGGDVKPNKDDGSVTVPEGSEVKKPDGSTETVPEGGAKVKPDGTVTPITQPPVHEHEWSAWKITKEPTLTEAGTAERDCTKDAPHKDTVTLPALSDTNVWTEDESRRVEPTETMTGSQTYTSEYGEVTVELPALPHAHEWGDWEIIVKPTWDAAGTAARVCTKDESHRETKEVPALSDTTVWTEDTDKKVEPTDTEDGSQTFTSTEYGDVTVIIPATGHTHEWGDWTITTEPTMDAQGAAERVCTMNPDHKETVTLPALSDTNVWTEDESRRVEPTETMTGSQTYTSEYGEVTVELPALPHTHEWGEWTITENPTLTDTGTAERVCTKDSTHKDTKELPALSDTTVWTPGTRVEPTEDEDGYQEYDSEYGKVAVVLPALPPTHTHSWSDWTITKEPTMTDTGTAERDCTADAPHKDTVTLPALSDAGTWTLTASQEPTEDEDGSQTYTSQYGTVTITIPATGHTHVWAKTWTSDKDNHWHECTTGKCKIDNSQKDGYAAHRMNEGAVTKQPTNAEPGLRTYQCKDCLRILRTETIPALGFVISGTVTQDNAPAAGVTVTLWQGEKIEGKEAITDDEGNYSFSGVAPGTYNVVGEKDGKKMTKLVVITVDNATNQNLQMPSGNVNSILEVKADSTTPGTETAAEVSRTVVGGLDEEAEAQKANDDVSTVTVTMTVEKEDDNSSSEQTAIKKESGNDKKLEFLTIKVLKEVITGSTQTSEEELKETKKLIEIVIPYNFSGKKDVTVYRHHENIAEALKNENSKQEGTFWLDKISGLIYIYTQKFSTYGIGYTEVDQYTLTVNGGQGSGTYEAGEKVFISAGEAPSGKRFNGWGVTGGSITISAQQGGYIFTMPAANVTVTAKFADISTGGSDTGSSWGPIVTPSVYPPEIQQPEHGTVTVSPAQPSSGDKVTVTITPEDGYETQEVTVTDRNGAPVPVTKNDDGTYTFVQPAGKVTVTAVLKEAADVCPRDETCPISAFPDASAAAWYHDGVHYCLAHGLMSGYDNGQFGPGDTLSRAMLAQILYNREGRPDAGNALFTDVAADAWYAPAVAWASADGIVTGYGDGRFGPEDSITREQLAVMLWRYAGNPVATDKELRFADANKASQWALEALRWAVEKGILTGKDGGRLDPAGRATRAEAATMLMRYLSKEER